MEAVINEIKNRYTEQKIQAMSQDDLQKEVMEEIIRRKQSENKKAARDRKPTEVTSKPVFEEESTGTFANTIHEVTQ
jgi:hypothetical protein